MTHLKVKHVAKRAEPASDQLLKYIIDWLVTQTHHAIYKRLCHCQSYFIVAYIFFSFDLLSGTTAWLSGAVEDEEDQLTDTAEKICRCSISLRKWAVNASHTGT